MFGIGEFDNLNSTLKGLTAQLAELISTLNSLVPINSPTLNIDTDLRVDGKILWWDNGASSFQFAWASPKNAVVDLRDFMDARFGVGGWSYRTTPGSGTNAADALEDALTFLRANYNAGVVLVPSSGGWRFTRAISATLLSGNTLKGNAIDYSQLYFDNDAAVFLTWSGAGGFTGGGLFDITIYLEEDNPGSASDAIRVICPDATNGANKWHSQRVLIDALGTSDWQNGVTIDGSARTSPQGVRFGSLRDIEVFGCANAAGIFNNAVQWSVDNWGSFSGTAAGADVYITGGVASNLQTTQMSFTRFSVGNILHIDNCKKIHLVGTAAEYDVDNATTSYCSGWLEGGTLTGSFGAPNGVTHLP